jgi:endoplasmic reticulum-Golgi intermediate compartment protein 2
MFSRILKKAIVIDAFPKVESDYQHRSAQGGLVTIIVSIFLWFLIVSEFREYWYLNQKYEFIVDQNINHKLQINVDITVNIPCNCEFNF